MEYVITDDVTLNDAISYVTEIYDPAILDSYIDGNSNQLFIANQEYNVIH
jgi:hypothetical protein